MERLLEIIEGIYIITIMCLALISFFNKKPSKILGFLLLPMGLWMLKFYPEKRYLAWGLITLSVLYLLRGVRVVAFCSKSIWKKRRKAENVGIFYSGFEKEKTIFSKTGKIVSVAAAIGVAFMIISTGRKETAELVFRSIMAVIASGISYIVADIVLIRMISPVISVKTEVKQDVVRDVVWINELMGRSSVRRLYILFEQDERCFVTYSIYAKQLEDLIGCQCEYKVNLSFLGCEFMMELPQKISKEKREVRQLEFYELKKEFHKDYSLSQKITEGFFEKNRWFFISFFGMIFLLGITMLFLTLFIK